MFIRNPLQMNDWEIKKFLIAVFAIQLALWGLIGLEALGFQIPILRQMVGFIYLTFVPGILIIRTLKLHKLGNIETLLYAVGLSIASLMFIGLFMNIFYPLFEIAKPISFEPLIITISSYTLILSILSYFRDKEFTSPSFIGANEFLSSKFLSLCLLPFVAIFGTYLVNFYQSNILLMILIVLLAVIPIFASFELIPRNLYPFGVFVIAISLLYHNSLITMNLWGWDIHIEYYFSSLVVKNGYWDRTIYCNANALLPIVMLAPIYSIIMDIELTWLFKIVYPLLFSLVPVGLYRIFQKQTNERIAFLACFFFISLGVFYSEMLEMTRQQIAELFLVLLVLLIVDKNTDVKRRFLYIVFSISLVVSHYGTSYVYIFLLISSLLILPLINFLVMQEVTSKFKFGTKRKHARANNSINSISLILILLYITFIFTWYIYNSSSSLFETIVNIGNRILANMNEILNPEASHALYLIMREPVSPLHYITKILHYIAQFFIILGIFDLIFTRRLANKFDMKYSAISISFFLGYFIILAFPYFGLGTTRLYHLSLIFLAPFCVTGGITAIRVTIKLIGSRNQTIEVALKVLSVFFMVFLLFNSGWVYEVAKDKPSSISLSKRDYPKFNTQEVLCAKWLNTMRTGPIYADAYRWLILIEFEGYYGFTWRVNFQNAQDEGLYIYLGTFNIKENKILLERYIFSSVEITPIDVKVLIKKRYKIYDNGGAQIYR